MYGIHEMSSYTIQQGVQIVELLYGNQHSASIFSRSHEFYGLMVHSKAPLVELLRNFKILIRWKIEKIDNTVIAVKGKF